MRKIIYMLVCATLLIWGIPSYASLSNMSPVAVKGKSTETNVFQIKDADGDALVTVPEDGGITLGETPASTPAEGTIWYDTASDTLKYRDASSTNTVATGAAANLDAAYGAGETINLDADGDIELDLTVTGRKIQIANTFAGTQAVALEIDSEADNQAITDALLFNTSGTSATITDAIDASDTGVTNAINIGANKIIGTTGVIDLTDFDVSADGVITLASDDSPADMIALSPSAAATDGIDASNANLTNAINIGGNAIAGTNFSVNADGDVTCVDITSSGNASIANFKANAIAAASAGSTLTVDGDTTGGVTIGSVSTGAITLGASTTVADAKDFTVGEGKLTVDNDQNETAVDIQSSSTTTGSSIAITAATTTSSVISATADDLATAGKMIYLDSDNIAADNYFIYAFDGTNPDFTVSQHGATIIAGTASTDVLTVTAGDIQITSGDIDLDSGQVELDSAADQTVLDVAQNNAAGANSVVVIKQDHASATATALDVTQDATGNANGITLVHDGDYSAIKVTAANASDGDVIEIPMANRLDERALNVSGAITGAAGEGVIEVHATGNIASTAALLRLDADTGTPAGTQGYCLYVDDDSGAQAGAYAVEINSANNEGLKVSAGIAEFTEAVTLTAGATLQNAETLTNAGDGVVKLLGDDDTGLNLLVQSKDHDTTGDASVTLSADVSGDNGDDWQIISQANGNDLSIQNDVSGSMVEKLNLTTSGDLQIDGDITISGGDINSGSAAGINVTTNSLTTRYAYIPISYVGATQARVGGVGDDNVCVGLAAGADEIGSTEGFVLLDDAADFLRFTVQLPSTFVDGGSAGDLVLEFDLHEQEAAEGNYDVRIFEYGNTTPIITDTITVADSTARGFVGLTTLSSGIGADADIGADDTLLIELTINTDDDNVNVYGARLTYKVGLQSTRS